MTDISFGIDGSPADWYAVYTRHHHERAVAQSFAMNGVEVFVPLYKAARRWKDRIKHLSLPLFPCYVFLRRGIERRRDILSTLGVYSIVTIGKEPAHIPHAEIDAIRRAMESRLPVAPHPFVCAGDKVQVKAGPLAGIEGIVLRQKVNSFRLILSAQLLERSVAVEVDAFSIEPIARQHDSRIGFSSIDAVRLCSHSIGATR
jgi:transcription antitermination factor NusG